MNNYEFKEHFLTSKLLCVDIETYDPELKEKGSSVYRGDGMVLGVAISNGQYSGYYDLNHKGCTEEIRKASMEFLSEVLSSEVPKVGSNIMYDVDWLENFLGIPVNGELHDILIAEPVLDEYRHEEGERYSLDSLAKSYLNVGKDMSAFKELKTKLGSTAIQEVFYMLTAKEVEAYAIADVELPLEIFKRQKKKLIDDEVWETYTLERGLLRLLLQMRKTGVRIDKNQVAAGIKLLTNSIQKEVEELEKEYGVINVKSNKQLETVFSNLGIEFERGAPTLIMLSKGVTTGNGVFDERAMNRYASKHPLPAKIISIRKKKTLLSTFFIGSFSTYYTKGRIHCNFHQLKAEQTGTLGSSGTVSGRFSSAKPNLQQIPSTKGFEVEGISSMSLCRRVFIPEENHFWAKLDWSQIEYRLIAHYASGEGASEIRALYNENPSTDYHQLVMDKTGFERKIAKQLNFALAYFMGLYSCSEQFGWTMEEAEDFVNNYHLNVPFLKSTRTSVVNEARRKGFLFTILKRKVRVSPSMASDKKEYIMFNRLIQASAADLMKKAMVVAYEKGLFNTLVPHLTVHDELDVSVPKTVAGIRALWDLKNVMENCVELKVPIIADLEIGDHWASLQGVQTYEELETYIQKENKK